jgi:hypothetical protein
MATLGQLQQLLLEAVGAGALLLQPGLGRGSLQGLDVMLQRGDRAGVGRSVAEALPPPC